MASFPAILDGGRTAVRYVRRHARRLGIDPRRVGAMGHSAGAHMAPILVARIRSLPATPSGARASSRVDAVVPVSAPTDLSRFTEESLEFYAKLLLGKRLSESQREFRELSPITFVKEAFPTMLVHGTKDAVIKVEQSGVLAERLKKARVPHELVLVEGGAHLLSKSRRSGRAPSKDTSSSSSGTSPALAPLNPLGHDPRRN